MRIHQNFEGVNIQLTVDEFRRLLLLIGEEAIESDNQLLTEQEYDKLDDLFEPNNYWHIEEDEDGGLVFIDGPRPSEIC